MLSLIQTISYLRKITHSYMLQHTTTCSLRNCKRVKFGRYMWWKFIIFYCKFFFRNIYLRGIFHNSHVLQFVVLVYINIHIRCNMCIFFTIKLISFKIDEHSKIMPAVLLPPTTKNNMTLFAWWDTFYLTLL